MNPAGIPYFYLALDPETAKNEILYFKKTPRYALAKLRSKVALRVVDLCNIPRLPSTFEPERYQERHELIFLINFSDEISKRVIKDDKEHIDYVPAR